MFCFYLTGVGIHPVPEYILALFLGVRVATLQASLVGWVGCLVNSNPGGARVRLIRNLFGPSPIVLPP